MFETGVTYNFTFLSADDNGAYYPQRETWTVTATDGSLLKLHSPEVNSLYGKRDAETKIVNTASPMFLDATIQADLIGEVARAMAESSKS